MKIPYGYACGVCDFKADQPFDRGEAPAIIHVQHGCATTVLRRDYSGIHVTGNDPFRKAWLSSAIDRNLQEQGRGLDPIAPKDKHEAEHVRRKTGRVYFGNDTSQLNPKARRAVESRTLERQGTPGMSKD